MRTRQSAFQKVGECLYRYSSNGVYYARFESSGKEIRRSLRTTDRASGILRWTSPTFSKSLDIDKSTSIELRNSRPCANTNAFPPLRTRRSIRKSSANIAIMTKRRNVCRSIGFEFLNSRGIFAISDSIFGYTGESNVAVGEELVKAK